MTARTSMQAFHDPATGTVSYVVWDVASRQAAVIDPVLDFEFKSGHTGTESVPRLVTCLDENALQLQFATVRTWPGVRVR